VLNLYLKVEIISALDEKTLTNGWRKEGESSYPNVFLIKISLFILQSLEMTFHMFTRHLVFIQVNTQNKYYTGVELWFMRNRARYLFCRQLEHGIYMIEFSTAFVLCYFQGWKRGWVW